MTALALGALLVAAAWRFGLVSRAKRLLRFADGRPATGREGGVREGRGPELAGPPQPETAEVGPGAFEAPGPVSRSDIFLSYARQDITKASALAAALEERGWSVWWDRRIPAGQRFADVIEDQLKLASCVVVVWSKAGVESTWVKREARWAENHHRLVPVLTESVEPPFEFSDVQAADLTAWKGERDHRQFIKLTADVALLIGEPEEPV